MHKYKLCGEKVSKLSDINIFLRLITQVQENLDKLAIIREMESSSKHNF
jgi:hypothetical protein